MKVLDNSILTVIMFWAFACCSKKKIITDPNNFTILSIGYNDVNIDGIDYNYNNKDNSIKLQINGKYILTM